MDKYTYATATDFDQAWINFELDLPLSLEEGKLNPFYVARHFDPISELTDALLAPFYRPPKFFFSGHRGCGKSTELLRLLIISEIQKKYFPIYFSIRDEADIIDLDFRDVYFTIGSRLYREYRKKGHEFPEKVLKEIFYWKEGVEKALTSKLQNNNLNDMGASIDSFFTNIGLKIRFEPATRVELRKIFSYDTTGLMEIVNHIASAIYSQEHRFPLVLIDDLDKPGLDQARAIFHDRREIMMQPNCAIIYTVSGALFYSKEFDAIRDQAIFLPNINLSTYSGNKINREGYKILKQFIGLRMDTSLITPEAVDLAIYYSGGVPPQVKMEFLASKIRHFLSPQPKL